MTDRFHCLDCGLNTRGWEYYMVFHHVWRAAMKPIERRQMICIGCIERRLDRRLTRDDFTAAPVNAPTGPTDSAYSERLLDRLGVGPL